MNEQPAAREAILNRLPPAWPDDPMPAIRARVAASGRKVVVLDDDPTGTQTVHDLYVISEWTVDALSAELTAGRPCFYVLTNSRSVPLDAARRINSEIGRNLAEAGRRTGVPFDVVSRSDSTLRGHYPGEVDALEQGLGTRADVRLIIPFFEEGGRLTIDDVHYVTEGDVLIPAGLTAFAHDHSFGYRSSNLREWVAEKTRGGMAADEVAAVGLGDIRSGGPDRVAELLSAMPVGSVCVVNAACYRDMEVFVLGLLAAEEASRRFLYRTAASFAATRAGIRPRPPLGAGDFDLPDAGGLLFVVGSHVPKTTEQLEHLCAHADVYRVEVNVERLLGAHAEAEVSAAICAAGGLLADGDDVALSTSRELVSGADAEDSLSIASRVSAALVEITRAVQDGARCIIAKGGITSSDVATHALGMKRAFVLGQILPGVPVWRMGEGSARPGLTYVVFPGNVGGPEALAEAAAKLT